MIGVGICWDQWFPKCTWLLALPGAKSILYHSAIESKPHDPYLNSRGHWTRVMQGQVGSNLVPMVCLNCIGREGDVTFYGGASFWTRQGCFSSTLGVRTMWAGPRRTGERYLVLIFNLADIPRRLREVGGVPRS
jgi:predicted amidohydrolase